ncbi:hypothetical protein C4J65_35400 [Streptomyces sp. CB09001]|nr:hypothetical protein C4J65_35400 [Streptomyces sp. CB09001]
MEGAGVVGPDGERVEDALSVATAALLMSSRRNAPASPHTSPPERSVSGPESAYGRRIGK